MANRYFNKQVAESRTPLQHGGMAGTPRKKKDPRRSAGPSKGRTPKGKKSSTKDLLKQGIIPLPRFKKKDTTDREKITRDRIKRNEIKDRLDKLKEKMKPGPVGTGLNPDKLKKSSKNLKDQISGRGK